MKDIYLLQVRAVFLLIITNQDKIGMGKGSCQQEILLGFPVRVKLDLETFPCSAISRKGQSLIPLSLLCSSD